MSFESGRLMGRAGTLLIVLMVFAAPVIVVVGLFGRVLGSLLLFSVAFGVVSYIGQILFLVGMNRLSRYYREPVIFRNALYGFSVGAAGSIVYTAFIYWSFSSLRSLLPTTPPTPSSPQAMSFLFAFIGFFLVIFVGAFILTLVQSLFYKRAFYKLADLSGEGNFRQAGFLMLLGAVLTIVVVGALVFFIGWIFAALGFFSIRQRPMQLAPPAGHVRYCPNCGKENSESDAFCSRCGNRLLQE